jgi:hypothetical protein
MRRPVQRGNRNATTSEFGRRLSFEVLKFYFPHWVVLWSNLGKGLRGGFFGSADDKSGRSAGKLKRKPEKARDNRIRPRSCARPRSRRTAWVGQGLVRRLSPIKETRRPHGKTRSLIHDGLHTP